jgi:hypothetical protein
MKKFTFADCPGLSSITDLYAEITGDNSAKLNKTSLPCFVKF